MKQINIFLDRVEARKLSDTQIKHFEKEITEPDLYSAMKSMVNNKSPGNDGPTKEFYEACWDEIIDLFYKSVKGAEIKKELSVSQKQAAIRLIEKKDRDKRYIKNWRLISFLNVGTKILSKALLVKLKEVHPTLLFFEQTPYFTNKFIGEKGRLISDIIVICNGKTFSGFIVTMDI